MFFKRKKEIDKTKTKAKAEEKAQATSKINSITNKINNNSRIKKYSLISFFILIITLVIVLFFKIYSFVDSVPIKEIEIIGASEKAKEQLNEKLYPLINKSITSVNITELQQYLQQLLWLKNVNVYRNLNGKLVITVLEKNPYFLWLNNEGNYKIIDNNNNIVKTKLNFSLDNLIVIEKGDLALEESKEIRFLIYNDLTILKLVKKLVYNGYRWDIVLKNGIIIKMPEQNLKTAYLKVSLANKKYGVLNKNIEYLDARSINKLFIQPK